MQLLRPMWMATGRRYGAALLLVTAAIAGLALLDDPLRFSNAALLLTLTTLTIAVVWGLGPSLLAAVLAFIGLDFWFVEPLYTLAVTDARELLDLLIFLLVALIGGQLAGYARRQAHEARRHAQEQAVLYALSSLLNRQTDQAAVLATLRQQLPASLPVRDLTLLPDKTEPPASGRNDPADAYLLLRSGEKVYGTLRVSLAEVPSSAQMQLLMACTVQAAMALERIELTEQTRRTVMLAEADQLKTALLRAISHDLRTPLTIIRSSAEHLAHVGPALVADEWRELVGTIEQQTTHLDRLVGNLLDFSRLEAGAVKLRRDWNALEEVAGDVAAELWQRGGRARIELELPADLPLLRFDYALLRQALLNIAENALRYEPAERRVIIAGRNAEHHVTLSVINHGPAVEEARKQQIMEPFYHTQEGGSGLGLAIAKSIIELHQGRLHVEDTAGGGATFVITLPRDAMPHVNSNR